MVHRFHDSGDVGCALHRQVEALLHHAHDRGELPKLIGFRRPQWICLEERNDAVRQVPERPHIVPIEVFPVIVVSAIDEHTATSEEFLQLVQNLHAPFPLNDGKRRLDLPAESVSRIAEDRNAEAAFAVDEADDPLLDSWPFLLIARTRQIVTNHVHTIPRGADMIGTAGYSGIPANSQLHSRRSRREGQQAEAVTRLRSP